MATLTVVIGAGQAGLAVGYRLRQKRQNFVILEAAAVVGESWGERWDSLRLFTPAGFTHLPGMSFPAPPRSLPGKDAVAAYLAAYAAHFALPIVFEAPVEVVRRDGDSFTVVSGDRQWVAKNVIVASGAHGKPRIPDFAGLLDPAVFQIHSRDYVRPDLLPRGRILVVGAGNSGAEIALDLAADPSAGRQVLLAGRDVGHVPRLGSWTYRVMQRFGRFGVALARWGLAGGGDPLGGINPGELAAAGIQRYPRVLGVRDGSPLFVDDRTMEVAAVVWCTGFQPDHKMIHLDVFDDAGQIEHDGGVVTRELGLYLLGQPYQRTITSDLLGGVGADAKRIVRHLTQSRR